jgi:multiple sugar transport system ATP-binding protein
MLGAETYLYVTVGGAISMTARVDPTVSISKVGDTVNVAVDGNRVHLFDKETELVILS